MKNQNKNLDNLRHSCAHLLAAAVMELWPDAKRTIGPPIENGFYYDFDFGNVKISETDFPKIEAKMRELLPSWKGFERHELTKDVAKKEYPNNPYKHELVDEFSKEGQKLTFYKSGEYWDLCRGGHVDDPDKKLRYFKLLKIAGAYWRGSEKNKMLTRIYGTCFPTQKELDKYLWLQEEAKKRDHKKIGRELELFIFSESVGPGLPLLLPKGFIIRNIIENYLLKLKQEYGLIFVWTPHIARSALYKQSKHWQKYDAMMPPLKIEDDEYTLKPMNCPHHFQIYLASPKSYRDLPLRLAENATVYRYEKSGVLNGLFRVRAVTQDDSHWFVPHELLAQEIERALKMTQKIYRDFGLSNYSARISIRDKRHKEKYLGGDKIWNLAEKKLLEVIKRKKISYFVEEGEAAFYGPKIDFMAQDSLGREWQLTTVQLDFNQPENFNLKYIDSKGLEKKVAVLHIAILGAIERFLGVLIEHYAGRFPLWLSPIQVILVPIAERHVSFAEKVKQSLSETGIRIEVDARSESMQSKIRDASLQKVPYLGIIGDKELKNSKLEIRNSKLDKIYISIRTREGKDLGQMSVAHFLVNLKKEIEKRK